MRINSLAAGTTVRAILIYLAVWGVAVTYLAATGGDWTFPIASLLIFGLAFSGIIWAVTRKMTAPPVPIANPKRESIGLLAYLAVYAVVLIGFGLGALKEAIPAGSYSETISNLLPPSALSGRAGRCGTKVSEASGSARLVRI